MQCDKCRNPALFFQSYSGRHLCSRHLVLDIEARAKRSVRSHRWMRHGDHIAVVVTGDRKSAALLRFLQKLTGNRRDIRLSAIPVCTGAQTPGGGPDAVEVIESFRIPGIGMPGCGEARRSGCDPVTKIALPISIDDLAREVLGEFLFGDVARVVQPLLENKDRIAVICPFIGIPSEELDLYWEIEGTGIALPPGTSDHETRLREVEDLLDDFSQRHPATKYAVLHLAEQLGCIDAAVLAAAAAIIPDQCKEAVSSSWDRSNS